MKTRQQTREHQQHERASLMCIVPSLAGSFMGRLNLQIFLCFFFFLLIIIIIIICLSTLLYRPQILPFFLALLGIATS
jgi:hypothetical protein